MKLHIPTENLPRLQGVATAFGGDVGDALLALQEPIVLKIKKSDIAMIYFDITEIVEVELPVVARIER